MSSVPIQGGHTDDGTGAVTNLNVAGTVGPFTAGNLAVIGIGHGGSALVSSVKDDAGNSLAYTQIGTTAGVYDSNDDVTTRLLVVPNLPATAFLKVSMASAPWQFSLAVAEFPGLKTSSVIDGSAAPASINPPTGGANGITSGTVTNTQQPARLVGFTMNGSSTANTATAGSGTAVPNTSFTNTTMAGIMQSQLITDTAGHASTFTSTTAGGDQMTLAVMLLEVGDTTAPVLSSATGAANGSRAATGSVTTDTAEGTLYSVLTTSATQPSVAQIKAGQNNAGSAAAYAGSQSVTATGAKSVAASSGLTPKVAYYWHHVHTDVAGNDSTRLSSAAFTTHGEITDTDGDNTVLNGQGPVTVNGFFGSSDPVVRIKSGSISQQQVDTAHTSTTITLSSIARGNLPYTDANHAHTIEVDTDE